MSSPRIAEAPWLGAYEPGVPHTPHIPDASFQSILESACAAVPDFAAMAWLGRQVTYGELDQLVGRAAGALERDGVKTGDTVAVCARPSPAWIAAVFAALRCGATVLVLPPGASGIAEALRRSGAKAVLAEDPDGDGLTGARPSILVEIPPWTLGPRLVRWIGALRAGRQVSGAEWRSWEAWLHGARAKIDGAESRLDAPAVMFYKSGQVTPFTHEQLVAGATQMHLWLTDAIRGDETWLVASDLTDPFSFVAALGAGLKLHVRFVPVQFSGTGLADVLRQFNADCVVTARPPTDLESQRLAPRARVWLAGVDEWSEPTGTKGRHRPTRGPASSVAAEADDPAVPVRVGLAPTFAAGLVTCQPVNGRVKVGSLGVPLPGVRVRIVDHQDRPLEAPATGELHVKAPNTVEADRWFRVGSGFTLDADGYLYAPGHASPDTAAPVRQTGITEGEGGR